MINKEKRSKFFIYLAVVCGGILLLTGRENAVRGVSRGLTVCADVLIPSLFPFMVLSSFSVNAGLSPGNVRIISSFCRKILKMPCECLTAVFFGFVGGYPVGASVTASLYEKGTADEMTVRRLFSCCVNAGPAFVITAVGSVMIGNAAAGILLFTSVCLAALATGVIFSFVYREKNKHDYAVSNHPLPLGDSLVNAVNASCRNIVVMCGWVVLFSSFSAVIAEYIPEKIAPFFMIFAEVTSGVSVAAERGGLPLAASCISFGGICVLCQLLPSIKKCGIKVYEYLLFRIVNSVISFFITRILLCFADIPVSVSTFDVDVRSKSVLPVVALLVMCAVFITDISARKTEKMTLGDITG